MHLNQSLESWRPLELLQQQFLNNCANLEQRDAALARRVRDFAPMGEYVLRRDQERLIVGRRRGGVVETLTPSLTPGAAREAIRQHYSSLEYNEPAMVAGIDHGWLWQALYRLPSRITNGPAQRPPLYFLCREIESLWLAMHLHDWRALLEDARTFVFFGDDAVEQLRQKLIKQADLARPRFSFTLDGGLWGEGQNIESLGVSLNTARSGRLKRPLQGVERLRRGGLRIMGITSRASATAQNPMEDWLNGFAALGHETRLVSNLSAQGVDRDPSAAGATDEFQPDLMLLIDPSREELSHLPRNIPTATWIQDSPPRPGNPAAARHASEGYIVADHPIGSGNHRQSHRFMPSARGVNEHRLMQTPVDDRAIEAYACDLSFVSHAGTPADVLLENALKTFAPPLQRIARDLYDRLIAIYNAGGCVAEPLAMEKIIDQSVADLAIDISSSDREAISDCFVHQINDALFRDQSLHWAADMGLDLRLYGRGWEAHPTLGKFARGPAETPAQLAAIYRASRLNLHLSPHAAVHPQLLEGLCAGGFFLIRQRPADAAAVHYRPILDWTRRAGITTDTEFRTRAPSGVWRMVEEAAAARGQDLFQLDHSFMEELNLLDDSQYTLAGATLWEEYFDVAFNSRDALRQRIGQYLNDEPRRREIAQAMRQLVLEKLTYRHIAQRLIDFIAADLERLAAIRQAA